MLSKVLVDEVFNCCIIVKNMSSGLWIGFCHTGPISLCVDLFVFVCIVCVHSCCITVSTVGWT